MINLTIIVDSGNTNDQQQMSVTTLCIYGTQALIVPGYPQHMTQRGNLRQETFFCGDGYSRASWESFLYRCP